MLKKYVAENFDKWWVADSLGCWNWIGTTTRGGYGALYVGRRRMLAHRFSYIRSNGPISEGLCVCHRCDNPACVNPTHLFTGTHAENMKDMRDKGRGGVNGLRGEQVGNSKLTILAVREIKTLLGQGRTQTQIARSFGVTQAAVSAIKTGLRWRHVSC